MIEKNFKNLRKQFADQGVFYTPPELVNFMFEIAKRYNKENPKNVYDPTLGAGYLFNPFSDDIPKFGQELDGTQKEISDISQKIKIEIPRNMLLEMMEESMQKTMFRF